MGALFTATSRRLLILGLALALAAPAFAEPVPVKRRQEPMHRAFVLRSADGKVLATAEETAAAQGGRVHSRMTFRFRDGSLDDEEAVFTQGKAFHLISDHHIQKGPSFPTPLDAMIDVPSGTLTWHEQKGGRDTIRTEHLRLPDDLANGIMPLLAENFPPGSTAMKVSWVAIDIRPLLVTLSVTPAGTETVDPDGVSEKASEYTIHPELPSMLSLLARVVDRQPADIHIWVTDEAQPSFVRLVGPFYAPGPLWTVEPTGPAEH